MAKPTLLFLDEPTSGLDGQSAYNTIRFVRRLVDGGQTVLVRLFLHALAFSSIANVVTSARSTSHPPCSLKPLTPSFFSQKGAKWRISAIVSGVPNPHSISTTLTHLRSRKGLRQGARLFLQKWRALSRRREPRRAHRRGHPGQHQDADRLGRRLEQLPRARGGAQ